MKHKCDGCRYKGEHQEMMFAPMGVCYRATNLIEAEKAYNAEKCPYEKQAAADVVEVVRCRDCKYNDDNGGGCNRTITHTSRNLICEINEYKYVGLEYCSYGERKETK